MPAADNATSGPLAGLVIAVTRPPRQAEASCAALTEAGAEVIRFPVMDIVPVPPPAAVAGAALAGIGLAVFVSANAVQYGLEWLRSRGGLPPGAQIAAVGRATARALREAGVEVDICPTRGFDSEALLASAPLQQVEGVHVLVLRGVGGRELLADALRARGAIVHYAEVYRRIRTDADIALLAQRWRTGRLDLIVVTSGDGLRFLLDHAGEAYRAPLLRTPLAVIGARMLQQARALGFQSEIVVTEPGEQALVAALKHWRQTANRE